MKPDIRWMWSTFRTLSGISFMFPTSYLNFFFMVESYVSFFITYFCKLNVNFHDLCTIYVILRHVVCCQLYASNSVVLIVLC